MKKSERTHEKADAAEPMRAADLENGVGSGDTQSKAGTDKPVQYVPEAGREKPLRPKERGNSGGPENRRSDTEGGLPEQALPNSKGEGARQAKLRGNRKESMCR